MEHLADYELEQSMKQRYQNRKDILLVKCHCSGGSVLLMSVIPHWFHKINKPYFRFLQLMNDQRTLTLKLSSLRKTDKGERKKMKLFS